MAKQPDELVVRILRDIQQTQADHSRRFDDIERRLKDLDDGVIAALGLATRADVRHDAINKRIDALQARIDRFEKKR
jgi:hypothetical protein